MIFTGQDTYNTVTSTAHMNHSHTRQNTQTQFDLLLRSFRTITVQIYYMLIPEILLKLMFLFASLLRLHEKVLLFVEF